MIYICTCVPCSACNGRGFIGTETCEQCDGDGVGEFCAECIEYYERSENPK